MSVKVSSWAWHESPKGITGNEFVVLLALADIADDDGLCVHAKPSDRTRVELAKKARVSLSTWGRSQKKLIEEFHVLSVERHGLMNFYRIHLDRGEPVDNSGSESTTGQSDLLATRAVQVTSDLNYGSAVTHHKERLTDKTLTPSIPKVTTEDPVENSDDSIESSGQLNVLARLRRSRHVKHLDVPAVYDAVHPIFAELPEVDRRAIVHQITLRILGKAAKANTDVRNPTRYVVAAIADEPEVWRQTAFAIDGQRGA